MLKKKYIEKNMDLKEAIFDLELMEHGYRNEVECVNKKKFFLKKMDIICFILKQHHAINQEEVLKLRIKYCIEKYGGHMEKEFCLLKKSDIALFTIYKEMNSQHLSHLISFYSFLVIMKIEEELIIKLTLHSLDDFIKYKNELNLSDKILSFCAKEISSFFLLHV